MEEENSIVYLEKIAEKLYRYNGSEVTELNRIIDKVRNLEILIEEISLRKSNLEELFIKTINADERVN